MAEAEACKRRVAEAEEKEEKLLREMAEKLEAEKQRRVRFFGCFFSIGRGLCNGACFDEDIHTLASHGTALHTLPMSAGHPLTHPTTQPPTPQHHSKPQTNDTTTNTNNR